MTSLFTYQGKGHHHPEQLRVGLRNGLLHIEIRGEPAPRQGDGEYDPQDPLTPGATAELVLPTVATAQLIEAVLHAPPITELIGAVPFVCWFGSEADRDTFVRMIRTVEPGIRQMEVHRPPPPPMPEPGEPGLDLIKKPGESR